MKAVIIITKIQIKLKKTVTLLFNTALILLFVYFLYLPSPVSDSVLNALKYCATRLIPALFPFIVLVGIINRTGIISSVSRVIGKPLGYIFGVAPEYIFPIVIGALSGFPVGALCVKELYSSGKITVGEAERLIVLSSNAGPAFCISAVGISAFGSKTLGIKLYLCQLISTVIIGLFIRSRQAFPAVRTQPVKSPKISEAVTSAIESSGITMLKICSFSVFFAVTGDILCALAEKYFGKFTSCVCASFFELTLAARYTSTLRSKPGAIVAAFAIGWAGISVYMQTAAVLSESGISLSLYRRFKLLQGIICAMVLYIFF